MTNSPGQLPLEVLAHAGATAVGILDLEARRSPVFPNGLTPGVDYQDQLLLVRSVGQPLTFVHVDDPPSELLSEAAVQSLPDQVQAATCTPVLRPDGHAAVIVATVGRGPELRKLLNSLAELSDPDYEVILVDNRPGDRGTHALAEEFADRLALRYVSEPVPGTSRARNTGLSAAGNAEFVAFVDDDVVVDRGWLTELLRPFVDADVAVTTGLVLPLKLELPEHKRWELYVGFGKGLDARRYDLRDNRADDRLLYPYWGGIFGSGNSMAFRATTLRAVGGFDIAFGPPTAAAAAEDLIAFTDVILAGGALVYEPRSIALHDHGVGEDSIRLKAHSYGVGLTAMLFHYAISDWRFWSAGVRSLPVALRLIRSRHSSAGAGATLPKDLLAAEQRGRLVGPLRYLQSRLEARRSG